MSDLELELEQIIICRDDEIKGLIDIVELFTLSLEQMRCAESEVIRNHVVMTLSRVDRLIAGCD